jgi:hypothetical protein
MQILLLVVEMAVARRQMDLLLEEVEVQVAAAVERYQAVRELLVKDLLVAIQPVLNTRQAVVVPVQ